MKRKSAKGEKITGAHFLSHLKENEKRCARGVCAGNVSLS